MKIAICDDKIEERNIIKKAVNEYSKQNQLKVEVEIFDNSFKFAGDIENGKTFDIYLLDICMPGLLGTGLAKTVRKFDKASEIIFLTTSDEFAVEAFRLKATHYIIKPFTQREFNEGFSRAVNNINNKNNKELFVNSNNGNFIAVNIDEIVYIVSYGHKINIFTINDKEITDNKTTLIKVQEQLDLLSKGQFISPYKGYIVNLGQIKSIETEQIILKKGCKVPIRQRYFREVKGLFMDYMFNAKGEKL